MPRPGLGLFGLPGQLSETYRWYSINLARLTGILVVTWTVCLGVAVCVFQCCPQVRVNTLRVVGELNKYRS